jgi:hypothetical protein
MVDGPLATELTDPCLKLTISKTPERGWCEAESTDDDASYVLTRTNLGIVESIEHSGPALLFPKSLAVAAARSGASPNHCRLPLRINPNKTQTSTQTLIQPSPNAGNDILNGICPSEGIDVYRVIAMLQDISQPMGHNLPCMLHRYICHLEFWSLGKYGSDATFREPSKPSTSRTRTGCIRYIPVPPIEGSECSTVAT